MAKTIDQWLHLYGESHQNKTNKLIHWICVPVITWTVVALLWQVSFFGVAWVNPGALFIVSALLFYWTLSKPIAIGMALFALLCVSLIILHNALLPVALWQTAVTLFVVAWIGQFIGHKIEGKKPSFFQDLLFLFIGPAWLMSFICRRLRIQYSPR